VETGNKSQLTREPTVLQAQVVRLQQESGKTVCVLNGANHVVIPKSLDAHIRPGDQLGFVKTDSADASGEIYVRRATPSARNEDIYQARICCASQPKPDSRGQQYVRAEVTQGRFGISGLHLPCGVLRDYFYVADRHRTWDRQAPLYEILRVSSSASPTELRLAFRLRQLELNAEHAPKPHFSTLERAFNILAQPDLRACYNQLLTDSDCPVLFPYGGLGWILANGQRSRDGQTFFASRILSFHPEVQQRRFHAPLRKLDFYHDHAVYRDGRRRLEIGFDQSVLPIVWDATWSQWKHLLGAKMEIQATFFANAKYQYRSGQWAVLNWETALPSRIEVKLPADIGEQVETARKTHHRFGQFSDALERVRARIDREPVEREELRRLCWDLHIPGDFDVAQINWRPDYDAFFYRHLCRKARRLYLFRGEYILELPMAIAVETPQLGNATYVFVRPPNMEAFLAAYTRITKEDIRQNRDNAAEKLGFLGRVVHGSNPRAWVKELNRRCGEAVD
jgi:hypothetical protein